MLYEAQISVGLFEKEGQLVWRRAIGVLLCEASIWPNRRYYSEQSNLSGSSEYERENIQTINLTLSASSRPCIVIGDRLQGPTPSGRISVLARDTPAPSRFR
jgi:hypothetical protein